MLKNISKANVRPGKSREWMAITQRAVGLGLKLPTANDANRAILGITIRIRTGHMRGDGKSSVAVLEVAGMKEEKRDDTKTKRRNGTTETGPEGTRAGTGTKTKTASRGTAGTRAATGTATPAAATGTAETGAETGTKTKTAAGGATATGTATGTKTAAAATGTTATGAGTGTETAAAATGTTETRAGTGTETSTAETRAGPATTEETVDPVQPGPRSGGWNDGK